MSNPDYKEGRGDYYRNEGVREDRKRTITRFDLEAAMRKAGIAPIGMSYENASLHVWKELR